MDYLFFRWERLQIRCFFADIITSDIITSDIITSDIITSDIAAGIANITDKTTRFS
jgi:hypothetical protein